VQFSSYQAPEAVRQLKILAAEQGSTIQALTAEALNMLFAKYGKPTVATLDASVQRAVPLGRCSKAAKSHPIIDFPQN
jgi:hypothetical protein